MAGSFDKKSKKRSPWLIVLALSLVLLVGGAAAWIFTHPWWQTGPDLDEFKNEPTLQSADTAPMPADSAATQPSAPVTTEETTPVTTTEPLPDNPIDFASLIETNDDAYAWIQVPGCEIDYPIVQSKPGEDDNFYLHHNLDRNYEYRGCIYTQRANAKDFSDRVTVVYGHNMLDGTMFTNLEFFRDKDFFDEHDTFYIYTPGHILTYRIAAAIQFDDRHLLNNFDFSDDQVYADWIENYITNPKTYLRASREDMTVTVDDKLVILSTCLQHGAVRYLIQGVLISDERTN